MMEREDPEDLINAILKNMINAVVLINAKRKIIPKNMISAMVLINVKGKKNHILGMVNLLLKRNTHGMIKTSLQELKKGPIKYNLCFIDNL